MAKPTQCTLTTVVSTADKQLVTVSISLCRYSCWHAPMPVRQYTALRPMAMY
jgi:hypothetical protein